MARWFIVGVAALFPATGARFVVKRSLACGRLRRLAC
jgi:hypothetical protein